MLIILGVQMISIGLVAEIVVRTYHESQEKPIYMVREFLDVQGTQAALETQEAPPVEETG
jgi:hypothetical protein